MEQTLAKYLLRYATAVNLGRMETKNPLEWYRYNEIRLQIIELMAKADKLTAQLRNDVID